MAMLSDESKERILKVTELARKVVHIAFIPTILYLGYTRSTPRPSLMRIISPLA